MKKLTIEITDIDALEAAYPQVVETETKVIKTVNRAKLRPLAKAFFDIGKSIDGVKVYYAMEKRDISHIPVVQELV